MPNLLLPLDNVASFWPKESGVAEWMVTFPELPVEAYEASVGFKDTDHATKRATRQNGIRHYISRCYVQDIIYAISHCKTQSLNPTLTWLGRLASSPCITLPLSQYLPTLDIPQPCQSLDRVI